MGIPNLHNKTSMSSILHGSGPNSGDAGKVPKDATESQLNKTIDILKTGPKKVIAPASHLLKKAKNTIIKNDDNDDVVVDDGDDDNKKEQLAIDAESVNDNLETGIDSDEETVATVGSVPGPSPRPTSSIKHTKSSDTIDSKSSKFKLRSSSLSTGAKKLTATSQHAIQRTLSPIKSGVNSVGTAVGHTVTMSKGKPDEYDISSAQRAHHISRSFAGYITAASIFSGFKDLEDENDQQYSYDDTNSTDNHRDDSNSTSETRFVAPDDVVKIPNTSDNGEGDNSSLSSYSEYEDAPERTDDLNNDNDDDQHSAITNSTVSDTGKTIIPTSRKKEESVMAKYEFFGQGVYRNKSKFELSVVQKMVDQSGPDQKKAAEKRANIVTKKLKNVFKIEETEHFIGDYPCWLMGDVLLQGHLYITNRNILFFAYLPKKNKKTVIKSGGMSIKSYPSMRINRKWLVLREHTLSVYGDSTDLYFPQLVIDLRTALRAETYGNSKETDPTASVWVSVVTENRTFWFQAENLDSAKAWVTALKKQIFSSRNKGDEVAIKIPLQNVIDLEITGVFATTKSLRIKVIENPNTFAIDDYFIMFFSQGDEAADAIKLAIDEAGVEISVSVDSKSEDWKNSELLKSKIELLKNTSSTVKSTNLNNNNEEERPDAREMLFSSDEEESEDDRDDENDGNFNPASFIKKVGTSTGKRLTRNLMRTHSSKGKTRSSSMSKSNSAVYDSVEDSTAGARHKNNGYDDESSSDEKGMVLDNETNESDNDDEPSSDNVLDNNDDDDESSGKKWSAKSLAHGITSFTSNLLFSGPPQHFDDSLAISKEGQDSYFVKDKKKRDSAQRRYVKRFSLDQSDKLIATYQLYIMKGLPIYGKFYIGSNHICFRSTVPGSSTVMILPIQDIENISKESGFRFGYCGLVVVIKGYEEMFFEFSSSDSRDDCEIQLLKKIEEYKSFVAEQSKNADSASANTDENSGLNAAKIKMFENKINTDIGINIPIIVEDHPLERTKIKPARSYRFTLLTIGSRGDVQPYIALGKMLIEEGHKVKIVTHSEFKEWVEKYGIEFGVIAGDPSALMALMVANPSINYSFIKEAKSKFKDWIDDLLVSSWDACQDSDVLIESPSSIAGIHIAEKLQIPYFRAFTMPWTRTRAYPHAFLVPDQKYGGAYNYMTHVAFENGYWRGTCNQVNKWRVETLKLGKTSLGAMHQNSVPFIYNMSPVVFPPSIDFPEWVKVSGYWFLDEKNNYKPPEKLQAFMKKARDENKKLVYIGFGSIVVEDPKALTESVVAAVLDADVRCILNKGWSARLDADDKNTVEIELPEEVYNSGNIPHDWLFTQIDAAVHHGGSGSTGASLRFGLPTVIKPFFGDQKFYASRVEDMGVGVALKDLDSKSLSKALKEVTSNTRIIEKAKSVGEQIMKEKGVENAVDAIYTLMDYARKLSVSKNKHELADDDEDNEEDFSAVEFPKMDGSWMLV